MGTNQGANDPETEKVDADDAARADVAPDTESDPALDEGSSTEWGSEGGAVQEGPATATSDGTDDASDEA